MVTASMPRLTLVDAVRGAAIIGVAVFHLYWDMRFLGFLGGDDFRDLMWQGFARLLVSTFLTLVGVSLVLAHGRGIRWRAFWRRFAIIAGAAAIVSVGTYIAFSDAFVYFGVLHAIAIFSVLGVLFVRAPLALVVAVAAVFLFTHFFIQSEIFNVKALSWIGFWTQHPYTQDLVPFFPGFGFTLAGVAGTRMVVGAGGLDAIARVDFNGWWYRFLLVCGRWSLVIYLVHQPLLLGILYPLSEILPEESATRAAQFVTECEATCQAGGDNRNYCEAYCGCALDMVESSDLWAALQADDPTEDQQASRNAVVELCQAMTGPPSDYE